MPVYFAQNVQAISIYNPATGEVEQFDLIEGDSYSVSEAPIQMSVQAGKQITTKKLLTFNARLFDRGASFDMLRLWEDNLTPVNIVAAGQPNLQWYENSYIQIEDVTEEDDGLWGFTVTCPAEQFFGFETIFMRQNLLAFNGWQDANNDDAPDGYDSGSAVNPLSFLDGRFDFEQGGTGSDTEVRFLLLFYPISGVELTFSEIATWDDDDHGIVALAFGGAGTLASEILRVQQITDDLTSVNIVTPANTYFLNIILARANAPTQDVALKNPALTTNGKLTPGTKFMDW